MRDMVLGALVLGCLSARPTLVVAGSSSPEGLRSKVERHVAVAFKMLKRDRKLDAAREIEVALTLDPTRQDLSELLQSLREGRALTFSAAVSAPSLVAPQEPVQARALRLLERAELAYRDDEPEAAAQAWRQALVLSPGLAPAIAGLERLKREAWQADSDQPFDSSVGDIYKDALKDKRKGRFIEARTRLREALALNPVHVKSLALLADLEKNASEQERGRHVDQNLRAALEAEKAGDLVKAHRLLEAVLEQRPHDPSVADLRQRLNVAAAPQVEALLLRAKRAEAAGRLAEAQDSLEQAFALAPERPELRTQARSVGQKVAQDLGQTQSRQEAIRLYNEGVEAFQDGQVDLAVTRFQASVSMAPHDDESRRALNAALKRQRERDEARKRESQALSKEAARLEAQGGLGEALTRYEKAAARDTSNSDAALAVIRLRAKIKGE